MNVISLCGIVCVVAVVSVALKKHSPEYALILNIVSAVVIALCLLPDCSILINKIKNLFSSANVSGEYAAILIKSLGICFVVQFASDSCKDAGETALAAKLEFAGKLAVLAVALPLFEKIIEISFALMGAK